MFSMCILRLSLIFVMTALPALVLGQAQPRSLFVVKLRYDKIDLPRSISGTCLAVFPDGRFHMEQVSEWPDSKRQVFEDSLPHESLNSLTALLEAAELKNLRIANDDMKVAQGEMVWVVIPRGETFQHLSFVGLVGTGAQHAKSLPESLRPLLQWFQATTTAVRQRKLRPLKDAKPTSCWLFQEE